MWYLYANHIIGKGYIQPIDILAYCNNLKWTNDSDTLAVSLSFDSIYDLAEGRTHLILMRDSNVVFQGVIVNKNNKDKSSSYTAMDYAFYLNKNEEMIQFNNVNAKAAIEQLCNKFSIPHATIPLNTTISKFYKGKTISDIINDILEQCSSEIGEEVVKEMRGNVLWIDKVSNLHVNCKYKMSNDFSVTRSMEDMVNNVLVSSNEESDTRILENVKDDNNIAIFGQLTKVISVDKQNESQARNIGNNYLENYNGTKKELTCNLLDIEGCEEIRAKRNIYISIEKYGVNGYYKVKSSAHTLANNIHKIAVTIDFSGLSFKEPPGISNSSDTNNSSNNSSAGNNNTSSSKQDEIIEYSRQFLGTPYVWGGKGPSGFDCSGFVAYVFNYFGYSLTAYTYDMINEGTRVSVDNIQPCDLVFFYNTEHVGIYIGGDQFIHAPHTGDVVKISQFSGYYAGNCNAVVRVL